MIVGCGGVTASNARAVCAQSVDAVCREIVSGTCRNFALLEADNFLVSQFFLFIFFSKTEREKKNSVEEKKNQPHKEETKRQHLMKVIPNFRYPCPAANELIIEVVVHIFIVLCALTFIFDVKLASATSTAMTSEMKEFMKKASDVVYSRLDKEGCLQKKLFAKSVHVATSLSDVEEETTTELHNESLKSTTHTLLVISLVVIALIILLVKMVEKSFPYTRGECLSPRVNLLNVASNNAITLTIVLAFELVFITSVASKYIPTNAESVKESIKDRVQLCLKSHTKTGKGVVSFPKVTPAGDSVWKQVVMSSVSVAAISLFGRQIIKNEQSLFHPHHAFAMSHDETKHGVTRFFKGMSLNRNLVLPVVSACAMILSITLIYFTIAKDVEQKINNRQAKRVVDYLLRIVLVSSEALGEEERQSLQDEIFEDLKSLPSTPEEDAKADERIRERNAPLERSSRKLCLLVGVLCFVVVGFGAIHQGSRGIQNAKLTFCKLAAQSFVLSFLVAFFCEYTFLNGMISKFDGVDPTKLTQETLRELETRLNDCDKL